MASLLTAGKRYAAMGVLLLLALVAFGAFAYWSASQAGEPSYGNVTSTIGAPDTISSTVARSMYQAAAAD